jgi:hypothetical protein
MDTIVSTVTNEPEGTLLTIWEVEIHRWAGEEETPTLTKCDE